MSVMAQGGERDYLALERINRADKLNSSFFESELERIENFSE